MLVGSRYCPFGDMLRCVVIVMVFSLSGSSRTSTSVVVSPTDVTVRVSGSKVSAFPRL